MAERRRRGRGRLSSIDLLPPEADDIVVWASRELAGRERTQLDIYTEFRSKLIALQGGQGLAFDIPAFSSFNRFSIRQSVLTRRLEETREIATAVADRLDGIGNEDLTLVAIESIKTLILEVVSDGESATAEDAMMLGKAMQSLVSASKLSDGQRQLFNERVAAAKEEAFDKASDVAREAGVSADRIAELRREVLGVRKAAGK